MTRDMCWSKYLFVCLLGLLIGQTAKAQLLSRQVTVAANRQSVQDLLEIISNQGNFYFSYNSNIIRRDSMVNYPGGTRTVKAALDLIFPNGYEFRETEHYIIIRKAPLRISLVTEQGRSNDNFYQVSGYVKDDQTGEIIADASVYEKDRLAAALTDASGHFRLKLKTRYQRAALTVSKEFYQDTTISIHAGFNQELSITLSPMEINGTHVIIAPGQGLLPDSLYIAVPQPDSSSLLYLYTKLDSIRVQRTALGKFLLSSRLKMQSINMGKFFTVRPVQFSLTPGLSSNGKLNSQVVNNFSFNLFGGYSGGVNGFELGGLFNIDKKSVQWAQIAGLVNIVGGKMNGLQIGGLSNTVLDRSSGLQIGGINNFVAGSVRGVQIGGVNNFVRDTLKGLQIGGVVNYARRLKGVQIGLINIADSSEGYSIGLINVVLKGYHKLAFYTTETTPFNAAFKTGNHKLYSILQGGVNPDTSKRIVTFGYGIGTEFSFGKVFGLNLELSTQYCYLGSWEYLNLMSRAGVNMRVQLTKWFALFGGPAFAVMQTNQPGPIDGWESPLPKETIKNFDLGHNRYGWVGWTAGIHLF